MNNRKRFFTIARETALFFLAGLLHILRPTGRGRRAVWLLGCRERVVTSNTLALWRYLYASCPEIAPLLVTAPNTRLPADVPPELVVRRGTLAAARLLWEARWLSVTHGPADVGWRPWYGWRPPGLLISLKHGVTGLKSYPPGLNPGWRPYDMICVNSELERQLLQGLGIPSPKPALTGLARFATLRRSPKAEPVIFYFPTFRAADSREAKRRRQTMELLLSAARREGGGDWRLLYVVHPNQVAAGVETTTGLAGAECHSANDTELQDLLAGAALVVTDYSSIAFDAALLGLPVLLDWRDFTDYSRQRGVFPEFQQHPVGLVCRRDDELAGQAARLCGDQQYYQQCSRQVRVAVRRYVDYPGHDPRENIVREARRRTGEGGR